MKQKSKPIDDLETQTSVIAYLDLANMFHWQSKVGWSFVIENVIEQIKSIKSIKEVKVYYGFNQQMKSQSKALVKRIQKTGAVLISKPVKFIKKTVEDALLFKRSTLTLFSPELNSQVTALVDVIKETGLLIEEPKCNFDVEMTMDIIDDAKKVSAVLLFSGDSDLAAPLERLKLRGKKCYVVGVRGMVAKELFKVTDEYIDFNKFYKGKRNRL
jgi:uncharacterized LabA/DUF88 family protein